jgi:hypothetical protein
MTIKGIYRDGKIELAEKPASVPDGAEVTVTFQPPPPAQSTEPRYIYFGMFAKPGQRLSTEEDFRAARKSLWGTVDES